MLTEANFMILGRSMLDFTWFALVYVVSKLTFFFISVNGPK